MGFHFHNKETEVIKVENGKTLTKRTSDHVIDIPSGILVLATLILVGAFLEYQGEWLSEMLEFVARFVSNTIANIRN